MTGASDDGGLGENRAAASSDSVKTQLARILRDPLFAEAPRLSQLLAYLVTETLAGHEREVQEYAVGVEVFGRGPSFDPRTDTIVRVQARRLRSRLDAYYAGPGTDDPIVIAIPKGHYRAEFTRRLPAAAYQPGVTTAVPNVGHGPRRVVLGSILAAVLAGGALLWWQVGVEVEREPAAEALAVAVLPFRNLSPDGANDHLSDGVSEEILNELARYEGLRVIARSSAFAFKDAGYEPARLSDLLGVSHILQGSLRRQGQLLRVTAQLVDAQGVQLWSRVYDRELGDVFDIQRGIARAVVDNIAPQLTASNIVNRPPLLEAYRHFLLGREILGKRLPNYAHRAPQQFAQAVELDPDYAEAHAELAISLVLGASWVIDESFQFDKAQQAIDAALRLKPDLARAHAAQGLLHSMKTPPDLTRSERALRHALKLDANNVDARNWLAHTFQRQGHYAEALEELQRAARLDPLAPAVNLNLALIAAQRGRLGQALERVERLLELPFPQHLPHMILTDLHTQSGQLADANESAENIVLAFLESRGRIGNVEFLAENYARLGMWTEAEYWYDRLEAAWPEIYQVELLRAAALKRQGRHQEMLDRVDATMRTWDLELAQLAAEDRAEYGVLLAWAGNYGRAIEVLEPLTAVGRLRTRESGIHARHALAWAYRQTAAAAEAAAILEPIERRLQELAAQDMLALSNDRFEFAQNALLSGNDELAMERLTQAVAAGWRDCYGLRQNPMWRRLLEQPRLIALLRDVERHVVAQRRLVEANDAREGFARRLDSLVATRSAM